MSERMGRNDWLALGLERLAAEGPRALLLDNLCAAAGRTRGSFYHHFRDHGGFLDALGEHWRRRQAEALADFDGEAAGAEAPAVIRRLALRIDSAVEVGMRRLGASNARIQGVIEGVDRHRLGELTRLHRSRPGITQNQATAFAWLEYAAYVGSLTLWPDARPEDLARTGDLLGECLAVLEAGQKP